MFARFVLLAPIIRRSKNQPKPENYLFKVVNGVGWGGGQAEHDANEGTIEFPRAEAVHGKESTYQSPDVKETKTAPLCR